MKAVRFIYLVVSTYLTKYARQIWSISPGPRGKNEKNMAWNHHLPVVM